jgi:transcriptional regulator GlxA family with amidase domain
MVRKTIGLIVFEQMAANELAGSAQVFSRARISTSSQPEADEFRCYQVLTLGIGTARCASECGVILKPQLDINDAPPLHTLIVPGGVGIHKSKVAKKLEKFLGRRAPVTSRVVTFGAGIYPLAATGLLDGRHVIAHWGMAKDLTSRFPKLRVTSNSLFVRDGSFYTCAGGSAAIDLSLCLIEKDYGRPVALKLAQEFVVHLKRSGEQEQYSEALRFQVQSSDRFADISTWILANLSSDLSVDSLAQRACMSPRNFTRLFKAVFGKAPAEFVTKVRITEARRRLEVPRNNIENVATSVGFQSADSFSRAFEREVGCRPSTYRERLGVVTAEFRLPANHVPSSGLPAMLKTTAGQASAAGTNGPEYKFRR